MDISRRSPGTGLYHNLQRGWPRGVGVVAARSAFRWGSAAPIKMERTELESVGNRDPAPWADRSWLFNLISEVFLYNDDMIDSLQLTNNNSRTVIYGPIMSL